VQTMSSCDCAGMASGWAERSVSALPPQMRQQAAVQRKLDEILRVLPGADQRLLHLETAPQAELNALDERHGTVRDEALVDPATAK